jgi:hypothetical protein
MKELDATRGIDAESAIQRKMKPKNLGPIANALDQAINYSESGISFNGSRQSNRQPLPEIQIVMTPDTMGPVNSKTGFAEYGFALVKIKENQTSQNQTEKTLNTYNGILLRFDQKTIGEDSSLAREMRISSAPDRQWVFRCAVVLKPINADVKLAIDDAIHRTGDGDTDIQINSVAADKVFSKLAPIWGSSCY